MSTELTVVLKRLDKAVKQTRLEEINFRELAIEIRKKLKKIPFWVPPTLFLFWFFYKLYIKFGFFSFLSLGLSLALSTNLVFLLPKSINRKEENPEIKIMFNTSEKVNEAVQGLNQEIKSAKITVKQIGEKISIEKPQFKTFKLVIGDEFKAYIKLETDSYYILKLLNGESKKISKELIERIY
jgi:hypothetical protein